MKYIKKFVPVEPYEVAALKNWFSDLSAEGLQLFAANPLFATFSETDAKRLRYHIEWKSDKFSDRPTDAEREAHKEKGWKFVTEFGRYFFIYSAEEGTLPYVDDTAKDATKEDLPPSRKQSAEESDRFPSRKKTHSFSFLLLAMIAVYCIMETNSLRQKTAFNWVQDMDLPYENLPTLLFALIPNRRLTGIERTQAALAANNLQGQESDWRDFRLRQKHTLHYISLFFCAAFLFLPLLPWAFTFSDRPIETLKQTLPIVALAEIENDPAFYYVDTYFQRDGRPKEEWWERASGRAYGEPTIGSPVDISFNQAGRIDGKLDTNGEPYESVLWVEYRELSSFVSPQEYLEEYFQQYYYSGSRSWTFTPLTDTPFDYAVLAECKALAETKLYLISGQKILALDYYYGDADLTEQYDLYEKVFQQEYR